MRRPERVPPACMLVRPAKTIITSLPKVSWFFWMPAPSPSPAATITVMEMMPQAMPNMVSMVRRLWAQSVPSVSRSRSWNDMALRRPIQLLQNDFLLLAEALEDLRLHAVGDAELHAKFFLALVGLGVGDLDRGLSLLVVNQRGFRDHQDIFLFFEEDFGIGAHVGLELPARVRDRDAHFKSGDVVLLLTERRNLGDLAGEFLVLEGFHDDARGLTEKNLADVRFIDLALHVNFADVAEGHDQGGLRAEHQDGTDRVADIYVAREDQAVNRADDRGVAQIFLRVFERSPGLRHLSFGFGNFCFGDGEGALRANLLVQRELIVFLRVLDETLGHHAIFVHLFGALHIELQERHIRAFRIDLVALQCGFGRIQRRFGGLQVCTGGAFGGLELDLVELRKQLALLHTFAVIHVKFFHDAAGFGLDLHFGKGLNLAGGYDHARQVTALRGSDLRRVNRAAGAEGRLDAISAARQHQQRDRAPNDAAAFFAVLPVFSVS